MAELMPPVFADNLILLNLVTCPGIFVLLVQEDGL